MIKIDKEKCIGCGLCAAISEKSFKINDEGKAEIVEVNPDEEAQVKEAIESCPVGAIEEVNE
ncbi:MAG: ferredoxin [Patescibacteria group bacterium]